MEELKLIIDAMQTMSTTAAWTFIAYTLITKFLFVLLSWGGGITLACILSKRIIAFFSSFSESLTLCKTLRQNLEITSYDGSVCHGEINRTELDKIRKILPDVLVAYKASKESKN